MSYQLLHGQERGVDCGDPRRRADSARVAALARAAAEGDPHAWDALVRRFTPALRAAARGFRVGPADVDDVVQATWLTALTRIYQLRQPEAIAGWLLVTARRESMRRLQRGLREVLTDEPDPLGLSDTSP
jgi:DNA-directed RNA polymerase specialized sigma24 family protein